MDKLNKLLSRNRQDQLSTTFRTKTYSQYNISDFLPSQNQSKSIVNYISRLKTQTEPAQLHQDSHVVNQLRRKVQLLEEEKQKINAQLSTIRQQLNECRKENENIKKQKTNVKSVYVQSESIINQKESVKRNYLSILKNSNFIQVIPNFKQSYQVSVQTDNQNQYVKKQGTINPTKSDMQYIYQKLENLKINKKPSKFQTKNNFAKQIKQNDNPWDYTQNNMRFSNLIQKTNDRPKFQRKRQQYIELYSLPLQVGEKLLSQFINDGIF